ncbi:family 10 glycosylhydrolase, partial [Klebsiella variicola]|uniref:family 10 glycosylhydrolase n=1 Tax=Klebsiella variicola TaxID=244366 RepID=UPI0039C43E9B
QPGWVKRYGDQLWIDPGEPAAAEHTLAVVRDVLGRYAVDGVHIDDYFYPYPVQDAAKAEIDFPDDSSWQAYLAGGGSLARADWR